MKANKQANTMRNAAKAIESLLPQLSGLNKTFLSAMETQMKGRSPEECQKIYKVVKESSSLYSKSSTSDGSGIVELTNEINNFLKKHGHIDSK